MSKPLPETVGAIVAKVGVGVVDTQRALDCHHRRSLDAWARMLVSAGCGDDDPLARSVLPLDLRLQRQEIQVQMSIGVVRSVDATFGLQLGATPIISFAESRRTTTRKHDLKLSITIHATPSREPRVVSSVDPIDLAQPCTNPPVLG
jgi:hypothetical protein